MDRFYGTALVLGAVCLMVFFAIRSMVKAKRSGKSIQCGCDCSKCGSHCTGNLFDKTDKS